jgi:hypothetical protein
VGESDWYNMAFKYRAFISFTKAGYINLFTPTTAEEYELAQALELKRKLEYNAAIAALKKKLFSPQKRC